jgi:hypothetical protein
MMMLNHLLCDKVPFPAMHGTMSESHVFQKACSCDECPTCKERLTDDSSVFSCPMLFADTHRYRWKEFLLVTLDNDNTQKELREVDGNGADFKAAFVKQLIKYKKHYFTYRWLQFCRKFDILNATGTDLYIQTDYGAQPVLDSQDKLNSVGHGVCVLSCWLVLHSPQDMEYTDSTGAVHKFKYFESDHIRVITPSSGKCKDQDWFAHCTIFDFLIDHYKTLIPGLRTIIVWTDGAPNQYKCRQNFYWLSQVYARLGLLVIHRFGATAQFKGVHDKIGQIAKWVVKLKEKFGVVRVSTAFEFYMALYHHLTFDVKFDTMKAKFEKKQMAATRYLLFYMAASEKEAFGKDSNHVHMILDRTKMWNCTQLKVC